MRADEAGPALRWSRACVTALVALGLAVVAHASAGGGVPAGAVAVLAVVLVVGAAAFLGRPAGRTRVIVLVAVGQASGHLVLTALAGHGTPHSLAAGPVAPGPVAAGSGAARGPFPQVLTTPGARTGSLRDLVAGPAGAVDPSAAGAWVQPHWLTHVVEDLSGPHALMALCHLLAAAVLGWWLASGEEALWTLVLLAGREARAAGSRAAEVVAAQALGLRHLFGAWRREAPTLLAQERRRHLRGDHDRSARSSRSLKWSVEVVPRRGPPRPVVLP